MSPDSLATIDWKDISSRLYEDGWAVIPGLLNEAACQSLSTLYANEAGFRSRVIMARHGFGRGEYRYFSYPLPSLVTTLREKFYLFLVPTANRWMERMGLTPRFPADHQAFLARCHAAGQARPTLLLLRYGPGDYNCLHQDLDEGDMSAPIVSVSLGLPAIFLWGGPRRSDVRQRITLHEGDVMVWGREARMNFHGVEPLPSGKGTYRYNLTFRKAR